MALAQAQVSGSTPMGATLVADGATFRLWAPAAEHVYVVIDGAGAYHPRPDDELVKDPVSGHWTGFVAGVGDGSKYRFFVVGRARSGFKRDLGLVSWSSPATRTATASCAIRPAFPGMTPGSGHRPS